MVAWLVVVIAIVIVTAAAVNIFITFAILRNYQILGVGEATLAQCWPFTNLVLFIVAARTFIILLVMSARQHLHFTCDFT